MDFRITAEEQHVLFLIVERLHAGDTPAVDELSADAGGDVATAVAALHAKGWILVRDVDQRPTVTGLSPGLRRR
ncbi:hypothetical protein ACZ90_35765 [Streptomyces albus subsp. albus]|nr:hypothetical protein ACZ90_35765 [Streptomyces albus subsp. albus]